MKLSSATRKAILELYKDRPHLELSIGLLENGQTEAVHFNENKRGSRDYMIYPVGSICKPFTASLLAKLISEDKISLSDPLDAYIPGLPEKYYPSIRQLATHHSGYGTAPYTFFQMLEKMRNMNNEDGILHINPFRGYPEEADMLQILSEKKLKEQDYRFSYCNFAYGVLGYIIGNIERCDYFTAMEKYVKSLGLQDTSLNNSPLIGYDKNGNPCKAWQWERTDIIAPAGAMLSSMEDLLRFAKINMDGDHSYLDICHQKHATGQKGFDQGLAWRLKKKSNISYHVGNAGAFSCILAMDREKKIAVAIGMNYAMVDIEDLAFEILKR